MNTDRTHLSSARRVVVKLGTGVVTHGGDGVALGRLHTIVEDLASLRSRGVDVLLVSSGSVSMGARALGLHERPRSLGVRQACAAVGQGQLLALYGQAFGQLDCTVAQVLLTQDDLGDRDRALCLRTTLLRLLELGTVPILNENDSVSVRELIEHRQESLEGFGDNDGLSALRAVAVDADALVLLTDVDGLYTANPSVDPRAQRIPSLDGVDDAALARARGSSATGTGGMASKLRAAATASDAGIPTLILGGKTERVVSRALVGEDLGTVVWPHERKTARKRHIAVRAPLRGAVVVNAGALEALRDKKASLLPIGVLEVNGTFSRGDAVEVRDGSGRVHGRGLVNYDSDACRAVAGLHSKAIASTLGYRGYDALITRDNLALTDV
ncbi:MAG: glutamate 5-kinase [Myxococcota bacterium]